MIAYPLTATFRIVTFSPEVQVRDAHGEVLLQVKQKALTLREDTTVFADEAKTQPVYRMVANQIMGFGATHSITRIVDGEVVGKVRAAGFRSLWRTRYDVTDANDQPVFLIHEENPWIKLIDAIVDDIPLVGWIVAMFINPRYLLEDENGIVRYRITKRRSLVERSFVLEQVAPEPHPEHDERLVALALIQVMLLERHRG